MISSYTIEFSGAKYCVLKEMHSVGIISDNVID